LALLVNMKNNKIALIVEGQSDKKFFNDYFKKQFGFTKNIIIIPSSTNNTCKIMNKRAVNNKILDLQDKNCNDIFILIDLDSKCK
jgi:5S rRNA maturation endonuclease (ribonuclease M5)